MTGFDELPGSPRESGGEDSGNGAERIFLVPWSTRMTFVGALVDNEDEYPAMPHCRMQGWTIEPFSSDIVPSGVINNLGTDLVAYTQNGGKVAMVRLQYGPTFFSKEWPTDVPKPEVIREGTQLRLRGRSSGQFLTIPGRLGKWASTPASPGDTPSPSTIPPPPDMNNRLIVSITEFNVQWDYVDDPPINRLKALLGNVNANEFLGCPIETLLFEGLDFDDSFKADPLLCHTHRLNLVFRQRQIANAGDPLRPYGWNHEYREVPAGWTYVIMADGTPRYPLTFDFPTMFD